MDYWLPQKLIFIVITEEKIIIRLQVSVSFVLFDTLIIDFYACFKCLQFVLLREETES